MRASGIRSRIALGSILVILAARNRPSSGPDGEIKVGIIGDQTGADPCCDPYSDARKTPAHIRLIPIGNPLDVPIKMSVSFSADNIALVNSRFNAEQCGSSPTTCILRPAARMTYSNNSAVLLTNDCGACGRGCSCATGCTTPIPIWESDLLQSSSAPIKPASALNLTVSVSFQGKEGEFNLNRTATVRVAATCR